MNSKKYFPLLATIGIASSLILAAPAFAQTNNENAARQGNGKSWGVGMRARGVFGTVSAINGSTLTVAGKTGTNGSAGTIYSVDAANAKIMKSGANSSVSGIAVGDAVMIQGTINGSNVTATIIRDGFGKDNDKNGKENKLPRQGMQASQVIQGDGQPVVGGTITSINGASLTATNKSNVTYSIDASNAKITKSGASSTLSSVAIGDNVIVQGAVNGTSVTASSIVDQGNAANSQSGDGPKPHSGFFGMIGGFFAHLFGF